MNTAPNSCHCSSSQAFELTSNTLRMIALTVETRTATRISQLDEAADPAVQARR